MRVVSLGAVGCCHDKANLPPSMGANCKELVPSCSSLDQTCRDPAHPTVMSRCIGFC